MPNPDYTAEIAEIEAILNAGVRQNTEDGQSTSYDLGFLRKRLAELKRLSGQQKKRPRWGSINLGN